MRTSLISLLTLSSLLGPPGPTPATTSTPFWARIKAALR